MQGRMKQHQLSKAEIDDVLNKGQVGSLATYNENGFPYVVPVHYIVCAEQVYIHGLIHGEQF